MAAPQLWVLVHARDLARPSHPLPEGHAGWLTARPTAGVQRCLLLLAVGWAWRRRLAGCRCSRAYWLPLPLLAVSRHCCLPAVQRLQGRQSSLQRLLDPHETVQVLEVWHAAAAEGKPADVACSKSN